WRPCQRSVGSAGPQEPGGTTGRRGVRVAHPWQQHGWIVPMNPSPVRPIARRLAALDWTAIGDSLDRLGYATTGPLLSAEECAGLVALYGEAGRFRRRVIMQHHGYGRGEYQYFAYPLPALVGQLRKAVYPHLAAVARRWNER